MMLETTTILSIIITIIVMLKCFSEIPKGVTQLIKSKTIKRIIHYSICLNKEMDIICLKVKAAFENSVLVKEFSDDYESK